MHQGTDTIVSPQAVHGPVDAASCGGAFSFVAASKLAHAELARRAQWQLREELSRPVGARCVASLAVVWLLFLGGRGAWVTLVGVATLQLRRAVWPELGRECSNRPFEVGLPASQERVHVLVSVWERTDAVHVHGEDVLRSIKRVIYERSEVRGHLGIKECMPMRGCMLAERVLLRSVEGVGVQKEEEFALQVRMGGGGARNMVEALRALRECDKRERRSTS